MPLSSPRVTRDAPLLWGGVAYTLFSVAVAKGSTAVAVGGSATVPFGAGSAGAILYTVNGGLTWVPAVYPGAASANVPCLMTAAVQPASGHAVKPIWAGGYATQTDFAFLTLGAGLLLAPGAADFCALRRTRRILSLLPRIPHSAFGIHRRLCSHHIACSLAASRVCAEAVSLKPLSLS